MPDSTETNPYQAPQQQVAASGLAPDTEFLVSGRCLLCEDAVQLPRVCIVSGDQTDLLQRSGILKWTPGWIRNLGIVLGLIGFPVTFGWMQHIVQVGAAGPGAATAFLPLSVSLGTVFVVGIAIACWVQCLKGRHRVSVTWYVSRRIVDAEQRRRRNRSVLAACCGAVAVVCLCLSLVFDAAELYGTAAGLLIAAALLTGRRGSAGPVLAGRWQGLNVLLGVSPEFLREVEAIIERQS